MKERPILFSAPMVRAILAGTKTQTRRVIKPQPLGNPFPTASGAWLAMTDNDIQPMNGPLWGDELWVRETFCDDWKDTRGVQYRADGGLDGDMVDAGCKWRPSIHMPRWASRITLDVLDIRVERLQDISEADAQAEGIAPLQNHDGRWLSGHRPGLNYPSAAAAFRDLWESINGHESWDANPWVWVVSFARVKP